ncbi:L,D-transpeptidase family protein [Nocardioides nematodiphilus]|uniref:L,D-transpeptidase family protein n=1 Tax=Nocardioides nematodiphilus TaxID=2849669 RepID=UPI001CDA0607|nr:L,D-transpeptidase family protein [Nocardioides nematodiphilus]MCA1984777.1 hypothetical protein [Nocardioides nematodiphilus]
MIRTPLALIVALVALLPGAADASSPAPRAGVIRLDGVAVHLRPGTRQVVTVNHTSGTYARVSLWALRHEGWRRILTTSDGRTGYGGLVPGKQRHQGTGATPLGTYGLISAFGTHRAAATDTALPYRRIRPGDFWVEDNASPYYNRYRNQRAGGFRWQLPLSDENGSERLSDYPVQYEDAIVLDYNQEQVRHRGAGIFLHVNGPGATAGCVSAPRRVLQRLMHRLDPRRVPVIAIGR